MFTTRSIVPYSLTGLCVGISPRSQVSTGPNSRSLLATSKLKHKCQFLGNQRLEISRTSLELQHARNTKMDMTVFSGVEFGFPLPSDLSPESWKFWILGLLVTLSLPFGLNIWWSSVKSKIDTLEETAERVVNTVEKVAEEVEKVADEVADRLPEGGKLQQAAMFVENIAKETTKDAQLAEEILDKVEEVEEKVESFIEAQAKGSTKEEKTTN